LLVCITFLNLLMIVVTWPISVPMEVLDKKANV
jgi:hypothetical protein